MFAATPLRQSYLGLVRSLEAVIFDHRGIDNKTIASCHAALFNGPHAYLALSDQEDPKEFACLLHNLQLATTRGKRVLVDGNWDKCQEQLHHPKTSKPLFILKSEACGNLGAEQRLAPCREFLFYRLSRGIAFVPPTVLVREASGFLKSYQLFLEGATPFQNGKHELPEDAIPSMRRAFLHMMRCLQMDPNSGNIMQHAGTIYAVDGEGILPAAFDYKTQDQIGARFRSGCIQSPLLESSMSLTHNLFLKREGYSFLPALERPLTEVELSLIDAIDIATDTKLIRETLPEGRPTEHVLRHFRASNLLLKQAAQRQQAGIDTSLYDVVRVYERAFYGFDDATKSCIPRLDDGKDPDDLQASIAELFDSVLGGEYAFTAKL